MRPGMGRFHQTRRYWGIPLPTDAADMAYGQKLRNQLRRARRDILIAREAGNRIMPNWWNSISVRGPSRRGRGIFSGTSARMWRPVPDALLFAARDCEARCRLRRGRLHGARNRFLPVRLPLPGKPARHGGRPFGRPRRRRHPRGHTLLNLGLGINPGIVFFKRKWNATILRPHVETSWAVQRPQEAGLLGSLKKLFGM
mgnify:CR=1 FL=1